MCCRVWVMTVAEEDVELVVITSREVARCGRCCSPLGAAVPVGCPRWPAPVVATGWSTRCRASGRRGSTWWSALLTDQEASELGLAAEPRRPQRLGFDSTG